MHVLKSLSTGCGEMLYKIICPKCNLNYSKSDRFCVYDGSILEKVLNWKWIVKWTLFWGTCFLGIGSVFFISVHSADPRGTAEVLSAFGFKIVIACAGLGFALSGLYPALKARLRRKQLQKKI
jgi:hypothetical protein